MHKYYNKINDIDGIWHNFNAEKLKIWFARDIFFVILNNRSGSEKA